MNIKSFFFKYKLHHIFFWGVVFTIWYFLRYQDYSTKEIAREVTLLKVVDLALMIYITNYLLIPKLLYKKMYSWFTVLFPPRVYYSCTNPGWETPGRKKDCTSRSIKIAEWKMRLYQKYILPGRREGGKKMLSEFQCLPPYHLIGIDFQIDF